MITSKRLATVAKMTLVLPYLLAALAGFAFHTSAVTPITHISASHYVADVDPVPPGH